MEIMEKRKLSRLCEGRTVSNFFTSGSQAPKVVPQNYLFKRDFPGGTVVKNPPANAGDMGSIPGLGRSHMLWSN